MNRFFQRLKQEFFGVIPTAVFFFISFQLLALTRSLLVQDFELQISTFLAAAVGALVIAKVVLVVDLLPFVNRFPDKPLIYNVTWKTMIYFMAAFVVRYIENLIPYIREYGDIASANSHLFDGVDWSLFWIVQIWLFVLFFLFCVLSELVRVLGRKRVNFMFFGTGNPENAG